MSDRVKCSGLSLFKPRGTSMCGEVRVIKMVLAGWLISIVGIQLFVALLDANYPERVLNKLTFFNLPIQFWLTGHFLPLWFIILCALFNYWMDRHSVRSLDGSLRFTVRPAGREGEH